MNFDEIAQLEKQCLIPTYDRLPILAVRGEGCYLYDDQGRKYLDFLGGLAVNSLGYAHPEVLAVLRDEAETLLHVSNLLYHPYQAPLAKKLTSLAGLDRAFFANSGTEAIEGALKLARIYARRHQEPFQRDEILAVENSFHGRTFGALSATWPEKYRKPFGPLVPGVRFVRLNDASHLRESFTPRVLHIIKDLLQSAAIEEILELGSAPLGFDGTVRRLPVLPIIPPPLALEALRIAPPHPEFRLFQVNGLSARIERALDPHAEKLPVISPGTHVIDIAAVADFLSGKVRLGLVLVIDAVKSAVEVLLVATPGNAGHDVDAVAVLAPALDALWQARINAIDDGHIRAQVRRATPGLSGLKTGALQRLPRIGRKEARRLRRRKARGNQQQQGQSPRQAKHEDWMLPEAPAFNEF